MKLGFFDNGIGFRGTTRAIMSYAGSIKRITKEIQPILFYVRDCPHNNKSIIPNIKSLGIMIKEIEDRHDIYQENDEILPQISIFRKLTKLQNSKFCPF